MQNLYSILGCRRLVNIRVGSEVRLICKNSRTNLQFINTTNRAKDPARKITYTEDKSNSIRPSEEQATTPVND